MKKSWRALSNRKKRALYREEMQRGGFNPLEDRVDVTPYLAMERAELDLLLKQTAEEMVTSANESGDPERIAYANSLQGMIDSDKHLSEPEVFCAQLHRARELRG